MFKVACTRHGERHAVGPISSPSVSHSSDRRIRKRQVLSKPSNGDKRVSGLVCVAVRRSMCGRHLRNDASLTMPATCKTYLSRQ